MNGDIGKSNSGAAFVGAVPESSGGPLSGAPGAAHVPHHHHQPQPHHEYSLTAAAGPSAVCVFILVQSCNFTYVFWTVCR